MGVNGLNLQEEGLAGKRQSLTKNDMYFTGKLSGVLIVMVGFWMKCCKAVCFLLSRKSFKENQMLKAQTWEACINPVNTTLIIILKTINIFPILTVLLKSKLPPSRETRLVSRLERNETSLIWNKTFSFLTSALEVPILRFQTCFVYYMYRTDLRGRHDFHSHQQCVCTMCVL